MPKKRCNEDITGVFKYKISLLQHVFIIDFIG